jgi:hypothetical protein
MEKFHINHKWGQDEIIKKLFELLNKEYEKQTVFEGDYYTIIIKYCPEDK